MHLSTCSLAKDMWSVQLFIMRATFKSKPKLPYLACTYCKNTYKNTTYDPHAFKDLYHFVAKMFSERFKPIYCRFVGVMH